MITPNGYVKGNEGATGIVVTWGKDLILEKGGLLSFIRHFEQWMISEDRLWLQKCRNRPTLDIIHVYIIVCNQIRYRTFYGGYETGPREITNYEAGSWSGATIIRWPRLLLAGPFEKAPYKIKLRGFRAFRYCTDLW